MKHYGLLGGKLGHSLSPQIHELFFKYTGIEGDYTLLETPQEELPKRMEELRANYAGSNVTIPHKLHVMPLLDSITREAKAIGAVNTIKFDENGAEGYNTDYFGFGRMLEYNNIDVRAKRVAVLGTGGAARAVVKYMVDKRVGKLYLVTRDVAHADFRYTVRAAVCFGGACLFGFCHRLSFRCFISCFKRSSFSCAVSFRKLLPVKRTGAHMEVSLS